MCQIGGKIDEICLSLCPSDAHETADGGQGFLAFARLAVGTDGAHRVGERGRDAGVAVVGGVGLEEGAFDLAEERGDLVQAFAHGAAVAVDGDARQDAFAVVQQALLHLREPFLREKTDEQGGDGARGQQEDDLRHGEGHSRP